MSKRLTLQQLLFRDVGQNGMVTEVLPLDVRMRACGGLCRRGGRQRRLSCLLFLSSLSPLLRELAFIAGEAGAPTAVGHQAGPFAFAKGSHSLCTATLGRGWMSLAVAFFALLYLGTNWEIEVGNTLFASNSYIRQLGMARQWQ